MTDRERDQLNVLVIDDDAAIRRLLVDIVSREEHQAVPVKTAEEGLELLPFWTFQVAFIDQRLPGMEGLVLGEYLRRNNPDMTIALVTAEGGSQLEKKSRDLHIAYIKKPFKVADIVGVLAECLEAAHEREQRRLRQEDEHFAPPIAMYADDLTAAFAMPNVPARIESQLADTVKRSLSSLRNVGRYNERDRVIALSGLLAARSLGVRLPKASSGRTLFEEYDAMMTIHGRRTEFGS